MRAVAPQPTDRAARARGRRGAEGTAAGPGAGYSSPAPAPAIPSAPDRKGGFLTAFHPWADTPHRLISAGILVTVLLVASTAFLAFVIYSRSDATRDARDRAGASVVEAQQVRAKLSLADASAAALVFQHVELDLGSSNAAQRDPAESRRIYERMGAGDDVGDSLAAAMRGVLELRRLHPATCPEPVPVREPGPPAGATCAGTLLDSLGQAIPQYADLVSAARVNARSGQGVGETYLRSASAMMRNQIIPVTDQLVALAADEFDETFQRATSGTRELVLAVMLGLSGFVLILVQALLYRHSNRVFDVRLLAGSTASMAAGRYLANLPAIARACEEPGPFIYGVYPDRIEKLKL